MELGVDVNTSDMYWSLVNKNHPPIIGKYYAEYGGMQLPAWSLTALLELIPPYLGKFEDGIDFGFSKSMNGKWYSAHYIQLNDNGLATFNKTVTGDIPIDVVFEMIVWLKENKYI